MRRLEFNMTNPKNHPWFAFFPARWLGSSAVRKMSSSERGIYIMILANLWQYHSLPRDPWELSRVLFTNYESTKKWLENWSDLIVNDESDESHFVVPHLDEIADFSEKTGAPQSLQNSTGQKKTTTQQTDRKTKRVAKPVSDSKEGFDPLTYAEGITSKSGVEYPFEDVRRVLDYHFKCVPSAYWTDPAQGNITSVNRLSQAIDTMWEQVPEGWTPPEQKQPKTKVFGDPACLKCRGKGFTTKQSSDPINLNMYRIDCDCEKHTKVYKNNEWVDASTSS